MSILKNIRFQLIAVICLIGLSCFFQFAYAQEEVDPFKFPASTKEPAKNTNENILIEDFIDDSYPDYPGGMIALRSFLNENMVYPADSVEGKVYVSLLVDTAGRVTTATIKKSLSPLADAEVIRVVKLMVFKPALVNGKPVYSKIALPVTFNKD